MVLCEVGLCTAWLVFAGMAVEGSDERHVQTNPPSIAHILDAWDDYVESFRNIGEFAQTETITYVSKPGVTTINRRSLTNGEDFVGVLKIATPDETREAATGHNAQYSFVLGPTKDGWKLDDIRLHPEVSAPPDATRFTSARTNCTFPLEVHATLFVESLRLPETRILSLQPLNGESQHYGAIEPWELRYEVVPPNGETQLLLHGFTLPKQRTRLILDAQRAWLPVACEADLEHLDHRWEFQWSNFEEVIGLPCPTQRVGRYITRGEYESTIKIVYDLSKAGKPVDDSEFRLTAFGLPEPLSPPEQSPFKAYIVTGVIAVALIVAGTYLTRRSAHSTNVLRVPHAR